MRILWLIHLWCRRAAQYDSNVRTVTAGSGRQYVSSTGLTHSRKKNMELIVTSVAATVVLLLGHFCIIIWNRLTGSR